MRIESCTRRRLSFLLCFPLSALFFLLSSCGDDDSKTDSYDVYVYGTLNDRACYWKNGVPNVIGGPGSIIISGVASGTDIYLVGRDDGATLWKNGIATPLWRGILAHQAVVAGSDVYVVGELFAGVNGENTAAYWKNGQAVPLGDSVGLSLATGIAVSGSDIHIVGYQFSADNDSTYAMYWKNGKAVKLPVDRPKTFLETIAAVGNDILIGGFGQAGNVGYGEMRYWKNGIADQDTFRNYAGIINKIVVSGSDVYVISLNHDFASYWKNGQPVKIETQLANYTWPIDLAAINNDLFMVGETFGNSSGVPTPLYKNGNIVPPFDGKDLTISLQGALVVEK